MIMNHTEIWRVRNLKASNDKLVVVFGSYHIRGTSKFQGDCICYFWLRCWHSGLDHAVPDGSPAHPFSV